MTQQLSIFDSADAKQRSLWKLYVDGAARNNPGPAGAGIYITKDGVPVVKQGYYLGSKTNNQAEYLALIIGLMIIVDKMQVQDHVEIVSDSQLLIRQLQGVYKVRNADLVMLWNAAKKMSAYISHSTTHVLREHNSQADEMANQGIDKKVKVPDEYLKKLAGFSIIL